VKWRKITTLMMGCGHNAHVRNGPTCKEKWTTLYNDYKQIWDYMVRMGCNEKFLYVCIANKISMNLPMMFTIASTR
jgi:hypothetical protein